MSVIRLLLTVPQLVHTSSPYREMMLMAENLPQKDIKVTICSLREQGTDHTGPLLDEMGVPYVVARFRPRGRKPRHIREAWQDQKLIEAYGPFDIQHSLDFTSSPFEAAMARLKSRHFIYSQRHINLRSQRPMLMVKASLSKRIHCNSIAAQQQLIDFGIAADKLRMIYLGIDLPSIQARNPQPTSPPYVLFVGHIQHRKRQEDAIRMLAAVSKNHPDLRLLLAGSDYDDQYKTQLNQLAQVLNVADRVEFLGIRTDIIDLMCGAQALILCSERESLSWSILEAMSVGIPVISSAVDGSVEVITPGENGYLVNVGDIEAYAKYLTLLLEDQALNYRLGQAGRKVITEKFSISYMIDHMAEMYRGVL